MAQFLGQGLIRTHWEACNPGLAKIQMFGVIYNLNIRFGFTKALLISDLGEMITFVLKLFIGCNILFNPLLLRFVGSSIVACATNPCTASARYLVHEIESIPCPDTITLSITCLGHICL